VPGYDAAAYAQLWSGAVSGSEVDVVQPPRAFHSAFFAGDRVRGYTHNLYRYPARFSPEFVRACVSEFTTVGETVLDPFVGGGTTAVEALASGRRFVGFDLNPLAILLTRAKTTPLAPADRHALTVWLDQAFTQLPVDRQGGVQGAMTDPRLRNAPSEVVGALLQAVEGADGLREGRRRDAARALLLGVGQWAIDGRDTPVHPSAMESAARTALARLFDGLDEFGQASRASGIRLSALPQRRILRSSPAADAARQRGLNSLVGRSKLVVTSPPYPGVHVLYHRWQVRGRSETPLAYWLADLQDGLGPKHYTMGGRTVIGEASYFVQIQETWSAVRRLLRPDAVVIQLVAFARPQQQLPRYLAAMLAAGYEQASDLEPSGVRTVPNRRWYNRVEPERGWGREVLLAHRLSR
jgi:hypothetical protein